MKNDVIATRQFTVLRGAGSSIILLRVHRPTREPTGEYRCVYELRAGRKVLRKSPGIFGADSMQSLLLALTMAVFEVEWIAKDLKGRIESWELQDLRLLRHKPARRRRTAARKR